MRWWVLIFKLLILKLGVFTSLSISVRNMIKIYVAYHRPWPIVGGEIYVPIHAGEAMSSTPLPMISDGTADNISSKNPNYCELTVLYWIWKNDSQSDIIGLGHYRRLFNPEETELKRFINRNIRRRDPNAIVYSSSQMEKMAATFNFAKIFEKYDIIMPQLLPIRGGVEKHYNTEHRPEDLEVLKSVIREFEPQYAEAFDQVMKMTKLRMWNMFIAPRDFVDNYCSWLFGILREVEQRVDIPTDLYQSRIFGFMSERLLNVYVHHHKLKVKRMFVTQMGESQK